MRIAWLAVLGACVAVPAVAHDFWLQPAKFWLAPGATTAVALVVGHGANRELWDADISRVTRLISIGPAGRIDRSGSIRQGGAGRMAFETPGVHVVAVETGQAQSDLPAIRFNDYLKTEGLTPAIQSRAQSGRTGSPGREVYSRRAKALVRVGPGAVVASANVTTPVGMTLEIIPEVNPYTARPGQSLLFRIDYKGRPLPGALVKLTNLAADAEPAATQISNSTGRVAFRVPRRSAWQLNVVWTEPLANSQTADFDTTFSSLTFGFEAAPSR